MNHVHPIGAFHTLCPICSLQCQIGWICRGEGSGKQHVPITVSADTTAAFSAGKKAAYLDAIGEVTREAIRFLETGNEYCANALEGLAQMFENRATVVP